MDCRHRDFSGRRAVFLESRAGTGDGCPNVWSHRVGVPKVVIPAVGGGSSDLGSCVSRALQYHRSPEPQICRPSEPQVSRAADLQTFSTTGPQSRRSADLRNHASRTFRRVPAIGFPQGGPASAMCKWPEVRAQRTGTTAARRRKVHAGLKVIGDWVSYPTLPSAPAGGQLRRLICLSKTMLRKLRLSIASGWSGFPATRSS